MLGYVSSQFHISSNCLKMLKQERAWYLSTHKQDNQNIFRKTGSDLCIVQLTTHSTLFVYESSMICSSKVAWYLCFSVMSPAHLRKDTRLSPTSPYSKHGNVLVVSQLVLHKWRNVKLRAVEYSTTLFCSHVLLLLSSINLKIYRNFYPFILAHTRAVSLY